MRLVVQRVKEASCTVDEKITGQIKQGFMVPVGIGLDDNKEIVEKMAVKLSKLRVFEDENQKMNLGIFDIEGSILSISQFTLYADCKKGNRPSYVNAMKGEDAIISRLEQLRKSKWLKTMLITGNSFSSCLFVINGEIIQNIVAKLTKIP